MSLPGFDAEASIHKTTQYYRMGGRVSEPGQAFLHPAALVLGSRFGALISLVHIFGFLNLDCYNDCVNSQHCGSDAACQRECSNQCTSL